MAALLSRAWVERGHEVILCPTFSQRGPMEYRIAEGVQLVFLADLVKPGAGPRARLLKLREMIRERQPDVVLSFLTNVNVSAILAARGTGVPVIVSERTHPPAVTPPLPLPLRLARRLLYPRARAIVCLTGRSRDWLVARFPRVPITVLPNPVVLPLPAAEPALAPADVLPEGRRVVLCAGRLLPLKRFDLAIAALARISEAQPDLDLVILGEGPDRARLEAAVAAAGLGQRVHLPGFAGNLADWYARAEMLVLPSAYEGFPMVLLEAMAQGLPTISFDVTTGPRDMTDGGRRGLLLPDTDHVPALAAAMARLAGDADLRRRLGETATEVREVYGEAHVLTLWDDLFRRVLKATAA